MDDSMRTSDRRTMMIQSRTIGPLPSPADSLLSRLDQFDHRLRQLEEKQRQSSADCYFAADVQLMAAARSGEHHRSNSLSAMHDMQLKKALMHRLHLLETRLREISFELGKEAGVSTNRGGKNTTGDGDGDSGSGAVAASEEIKNDDDGVCTNTSVVGRTWKTGVFFKNSAARDPQTQKLKTTQIKTKDLETVVGAAEKAASAMCQNEKRRADRTRLYRRWLPVGC